MKKVLHWVFTADNIQHVETNPTQSEPAMDYTPEQVARSMTRGYRDAHHDFAVSPDHVRQVVTMRRSIYGSYDICDWPTNDQQRTILSLAFSDYRAAKANALKVVPCPPAVTYNDDVTQAYLDGVSYGYRCNGDWDGMGVLGKAYAAGADMGRFWRLDDPRSILLG